jgi:penicillin G amidase
MRWPAVFAVQLALAGCDDGLANGPFDALPLDVDLTVGLGAVVHVARDRFGIAHIAAESLGDAAFVQGYVTAHDRLPQMDLLRRFAGGTLAELYGASDPSTIDTDLEMRMHRMALLATQTFTALEASQAPIDRQLVTLLQRFADGVNTYASDLGHDYWTLDPAVAASFSAAAFRAWTPTDSLVIVRFWAFAQSWTVPFELDATELYQKLRAGFDNAAAPPAAVARRGISRDVFRLTPVGTVSTIAGFPNIAVDSGSRADGSAPPAAAPPAPAAPLAAPGARPEVPEALLDAARATLAGDTFPRRFGGGNSWAVGPALAAGGALLAADPHLPLTNPSLLYPTHLMISDPDGDPRTDDAIELVGATIPGIPGIVLGSNGHVAWAGTAAAHDVNDVYLEHPVPCDAGARGCVAWTDAQGAAQSEPISTFGEDIQIGAQGAITGSVHADYEVVPHHGPIIPAIDRTHHALALRTGDALSVGYTGYQASFEIRALYQLALARTIHDGFAALRDLRYGGQNWMMIDDEQHIGWSTQALVPTRRPAAGAWDPLVRQDAAAPFFVQPADGSADWIAGDSLAPRYIPHAVDPPEGFLVTANADPVGATFDGLPLNQSAGAGPTTALYAGVAYAAGLREDRITSLLHQATAGPAGATLDDMARIQRDTHSSVGERLTPAILAALARVANPTGSPADLLPYVTALSDADLARLAMARDLLAAWTFETPAATDAPDRDSAATALFHTWMHFFVQRTLADELAAVGFDVWRLAPDQLVRIVYAMLGDPRALVTSPATQEPILCGDYAGADTSCTVQVLAAMLDAMTALASPAAFGTDDTAEWRWGKLHRLTIASLVPDDALALPPGDHATGFGRAGDNFSINRADHGWSSLDFAQRPDGPALRLLAEARPGQPIALRWSLPGGAIFDRRSPHYRDLLDRYLTDESFDVPIAIPDIAAAGETRWVFR